MKSTLVLTLVALLSVSLADVSSRISDRKVAFSHGRSSDIVITDGSVSEVGVKSNGVLWCLFKQKNGRETSVVCCARWFFSSLSSLFSDALQFSCSFLIWILRHIALHINP
jgi:hypothetical protein